jgi:hypothetical protein
VFYLSGACRDSGTDYPVLLVCDPTTRTAGDDAEDYGVGVSMNEHFSNAKWVAISGRAFFFDGGLPPGHGLTRTEYAQTKARAEQMGIYRAVRFQPWVFDDKPADVSEEAWKYEVSIGTDYATSFARGRFCARIPVTRAQTARMVTFLNAQNAPYRDGKEVFKWSIFQDNCIHLAHNALAAAGIWGEWPIDMPLLFAMFDFPVPKNEFVNVMRRINDPPDLDLMSIYHDETAADTLAQFGHLPWIPGAVAETHPLEQPNEVYDTNVALVYYDDPVTGRYRRRENVIFDHPRYLDIEQNLGFFSGLYRRLDAERKPLEDWLARDEFRAPSDRQRFTDFYHRFYAYVDRERVSIDAKLARLVVVSVADRRPPPSVQAVGR